MKEQSDQSLHCLPLRFHEAAFLCIKEQSDQGLHCLPFRLHCLDEGEVWSESTLFAIPFASFGWRSSLIRVYTVIPSASFGWRSSLIRVYTVCHSMKEQSDQSLHCLPLRLDEGAFRLHRLDKGAVWSGSTLFAIPFGWRSSLIRVYTVCLSICIVWTKEQSDQGLHCLPFRLHCLMKEQSDQGLPCLPFHSHCFDEGAVWSESTLFAIPFASFGWRSSLIRVSTVIPFASFGWRSSLIRVYTVCHSIFHHLDEWAVWSGSTLFIIPFAPLGWRSSLIRVYTVCHSVCIVWMKE